MAWVVDGWTNLPCQRVDCWTNLSCHGMDGWTNLACQGVDGWTILTFQGADGCTILACQGVDSWTILACQWWYWLHSQTSLYQCTGSFAETTVVCFSILMFTYSHSMIQLNYNDKIKWSVYWLDNNPTDKSVFNQKSTSNAHILSISKIF